MRAANTPAVSGMKGIDKLSGWENKRRQRI